MITPEQMIVMLAERTADPGTAAVEACLLRQVLDHVADRTLSLHLDLSPSIDRPEGRAALGILAWVDAVIRDEVARVDRRLDQMRAE